jgi:hypothetical protein
MFKKGDIVEIKGEEYEIVDVKSEFCVRTYQQK